MEDGRWRVEGGGWRMEDGGWRMEDGGWRMEGRGWRVEGGRWRMEDGCGAKRDAGCGQRSDCPQAFGVQCREKERAQLQECSKSTVRPICKDPPLVPGEMSPS